MIDHDDRWFYDRVGAEVCSACGGLQGFRFRLARHDVERLAREHPVAKGDPEAWFAIQATEQRAFIRGYGRCVHCASAPPLPAVSPVDDDFELAEAA